MPTAGEWYCVRIDTRYGTAKWERLRNGVQNAFEVLRGPADAQMYARDTSPGSPETVLYFSPGAARIAYDLIIREGGAPCDRQPKAGTKVVMRDEDGPDLLQG